MNFGERLKYVIQEEGMSQRQFAEEMDMSLVAIERYISGKREPASKFFVKFSESKVFNKYLVWLLSGNVEPGVGQVCPVFSTQNTQETLQSVGKKA
ncbi:hypothetical protein CKQ84_14345 [Shewanella sp. WE21]|uniref:helix-turn-helix domain-containing protein n=1 Tax=Shewanella sp. WE21 TaxID=2029986 RepID=UPI000CF633E1|nr:helix-turn-helix transcriptional regulator [Shewanella sp. WE21]AVI66969.1 hypothetical protein CKQ84_14345 [Shewanella sp. WE21]